MADSLYGALTELLAGDEDAPSRMEQVWPYFGETRTEQNVGAAEYLAEALGLRRRTALRSIQRYRTSAREARDPTRSPRGGVLLEEARRRAKKEGVAERVAEVLKNGALMTLTALRRISNDVRVQTFPAAGDVHIPGPGTHPPVAAWLRGQVLRAERTLLEAFFLPYWGDPRPVEILEVIEVTLERT